MEIFFYLLGSYIVGWFMTAYFVVKWKEDKDIRTLGSGNMGARNAGRVLGKKGFILTFIGDAGKGALPIFMGQLFHFGEPLLLLSLLMVIIGHIWPLPFHFRGGKGVATFIGGWIVLDFRVVFIFALILSFLYLWKRNFTVSGLLTILFLPFILFFLSYKLEFILISIFTLLLILLAHRKTISR